MKQYLELVTSILTNGSRRTDRTGTGTTSLFGPQIEFDLRQGFPAMTTKKLQFSSVVQELQWMVAGKTNIKDLAIRIWDAWALPNGELGPIYGHQWRKWWDWRHQRPIDQLHQAITDIVMTPDSRRIIVSAWNASDLGQMRLPPCHILFQFYVGFVGDRPFYLDCKMYQRSADCFLGVPFNIAQYALLTHVVANITKLIPRRLIITFGDLHVYNNHYDQVIEQTKRSPKMLPKLKTPDFSTIEDFVNCPYQQVTLEGYQYHPAIKGEIAV